MINKNDILTTEDNIVNFIFDAIFSKQLQPGAKLSESVVAKELGTSRDVIRKAFSKLVTMGILTYKKNQGFNVVWLSEENTKDIFEARKVIEIGVMEILTKKYSTQQIDLSALSENINHEEYLKISLRNGEYVKTSCDFHLTLALLSGNDFLINALKPLIPLSTLAGLLYDNKEATFCSYNEHRVIIDAIKECDTKKAQITMAEHLDNCVIALNFVSDDIKKNKFSFFQV